MEKWGQLLCLLGAAVAGVVVGAIFGRSQEDEDAKLAVKIWGNEPENSSVIGEFFLSRKDGKWIGEAATAETVRIKKSA